MKKFTPGDRVELTDDMEDLRIGLIGTVVIGKEHCDKIGNRTPFVCTGISVNTLAVRFDERGSVSIGRRVNGEYIQVVDKCKLITS